MSCPPNCHFIEPVKDQQKARDKRRGKGKRECQGKARQRRENRGPGLCVHVSWGLCEYPEVCVNILGSMQVSSGPGKYPGVQSSILGSRQVSWGLCILGHLCEYLWVQTSILGSV